eukprot:TRINITY_DN11237_c0_g1_i3.p1 TRINITY_DN11237_c0_g1~~TRINITY_DN11237_c0_g1_i3.p1  ORF type:complete len:469 (+),score=68.55 TRINITY_DN11237_c0_g1_i3:641-2047(+)
MEGNRNSASSGSLLDLNGVGVKRQKPISVSCIPRCPMTKLVLPHISMKVVQPTREKSLHFGYFLLKIVALELVRRVSHKKIPFLWTALQGIGFFGLPPLIWLQRWSVFKHIAKFAQGISKPLLFLSISRSCFTESKDHECPAEEKSEPLAINSLQIELEENIQIQENENCHSQEETANLETTLQLLKEELVKNDIIMPEWLSADELYRFYVSANGDPSQCISLVKKTIRWKETYYFFTPQELEVWSNLVFWHGCDIYLRPCLVVRLGLAYSSLQPEDRPRFAQAIASQLEHGITYLMNTKDSRIVVLMDCEGVFLSGFPVQMMKSCSVLVQEHYPTCLASLFVVNLPSALHLVAHDVIKVLKPVTQEKVHILGDDYKKVLTETFGMVPSFLFGECTSSDGRKITACGGSNEHSNQEAPDDDCYSEEMDQENEVTTYHKCNQVLRSVIVILLMAWVIFSMLVDIVNSKN